MRGGGTGDVTCSGGVSPVEEGVGPLSLNEAVSEAKLTSVSPLAGPEIAASMTSKAGACGSAEENNAPLFYP